MAKILMEKLEDALHPVDEEGRKAMNKVPERAIVSVQFSVPRSVRQLRLFFAVIKLCWENQREPKRFPEPEHLRKALLEEIGHYEWVYNLRGEKRKEIKSIDFGTLDHVAFQPIFDAVMQVVTDKIIPGVGRPEFEEQVFDMLRQPSQWGG